MTYYIRSGNSFRVTDENSIDIHDNLPAGNYIIKEDMFKNLYLEAIDQFKPLPKYYGDTVKNTQRIINTFLDRPSSTGVLATGEKGSGKTLLAKNLSIECAKIGIPTITVSEDWHGEQFNVLIQGIDQPCMVLFDEFEKVYDSSKQEEILTLLDGVFPSKKLFVLTCNDKWRIDSHMRNRPGRIFYMLDFKGLEVEFIREYCEDTLKNKEYIDKVCNISKLFGEFNFDMLKALVEDMNRYGESPEEAMRILNAKPEYDNDRNLHYTIELFIDGVHIDKNCLYEQTWRGNPLSSPKVVIEHSYEEVEKISTFNQEDIQQVDMTTGSFSYKNAIGERLILTRERKTNLNYFNLF